MRLVPLGVGDAFSERWYSTSFAIESEGALILVDCPHPIRKMLREARETSGLDLRLERVSAVVLTHLHADHASGLEGYGYFSHFALGKKARVAAHPAVIARAWDGHLAAGMERLETASGLRAMRFDDYFEHVALDTTRVVSIGPFEIECRGTHHHVPTTALRIRAGGRSLGLSADTSFDPKLIAWLAQADLVVHETNLGTHTPYESLAALDAALRAKMRLVHFPDSFDLAASNIECLEQGRAYEV
ncbi:MBL fold metallo-hydrolase [Sandaracinus amylolyticus]|uniref:Beta-lactamase domain protein n=1 Tax=Sandaracinus amylolyticus TaxID=927083 RepID=A0A0F6W4Q6_9BACT|nr:MBL fold metallo-hydrolase [Sandaracinus amylolyticus]AKF07271.1 beta-lactamase domain protein [Sandaracinus amylolyticus]